MAIAQANTILARVMIDRDRQAHEVRRLREGLRRIRDGNHPGLAETYAIAVLAGIEPKDYAGDIS